MERCAVCPTSLSLVEYRLIIQLPSGNYSWIFCKYDMERMVKYLEKFELGKVVDMPSEQPIKIGTSVV